MSKRGTKTSGMTEPKSPNVKTCVVRLVDVVKHPVESMQNLRTKKRARSPASDRKKLTRKSGKFVKIAKKSIQRPLILIDLNSSADENVDLPTDSAPAKKKVCFRNEMKQKTRVSISGIGSHTLN